MASKRLQAAKAAHDKWLKSQGLSTAIPRKPKQGIYDIPNYKTTHSITTSDKVGSGIAKKSNKYTGKHKHVVGLLYNKGNIGVISAEDAANPATGKRRT